ncbi:hypothetical protein OQA88_5889 [Cercophora sp. LCS_1]
MPSTTTQRKLASQFIAVTNATKENAQQFLKNANYNLDTAVNLYFNSTEPADFGADPSAGPKVEDKLNELFDSLLSQQDLESDESKNTMGAASLEAYANSLEVNPVNHETFVLLEIVQAEILGTISRKGFVDGWKSAASDTTFRVQPDIASQKKYIRHRVAEAARDPAYFKTLYQRAFLAGRELHQKSVDKYVAVAFWGMLFGPAVHPWRTKAVDWLGAWNSFLESEWNRSVNRDMWNQTFIFANKTMADDTLGFWSEDQAWPGVIDDFVLWCRETGLVPSPKSGTGTMDVDE